MVATCAARLAETHFDVDPLDDASGGGARDNEERDDFHYDQDAFAHYDEDEFVDDEEDDDDDVPERSSAPDMINLASLGFSLRESTVSSTGVPPPPPR